MTTQAVREQVIQDLISGFVIKLNEAGLDDNWEIERIQKEANALGRPVTVKLKGAVNPNELKDTGWNVIATTGLIERFRDKKTGGEEEWFGDGETLLVCPQEDMKIQQTARQDVQKLKGRFVEIHKHDLTEAGVSLVRAVMDEIDGMNRKSLPINEVE